MAAGVFFEKFILLSTCTQGVLSTFEEFLKPFYNVLKLQIKASRASNPNPSKKTVYRENIRGFKVPLDNETFRSI